MNDFEKLSLRKFKIKSILPDATILILGKRRSGKCHGKGTKILMYDGSTKPVEEVVTGDLVMGDDSTQRIVSGTTSGTDTLYKITFKENGESYIVNSEHLLSFRWRYSKFMFERKDSFQVRYFDKQNIKVSHKDFSYKKVDRSIAFNQAKDFLDNLKDDLFVDIPVKEYIKLPKKYKDNLLGYQNTIVFKEREISICPYKLGYWLAKHEALGNYDEEMYNNNVLDRQSIPNDIKINSRTTRLKLLAGILDASKRLTANTFRLNENVKIVDDIVYVARSLGFCCYIKKNSVLYISGDSTEEIPNIFKIKNCSGSGGSSGSGSGSGGNGNGGVLLSEVKVQKLEVNQYYGFQVDKNHRYVLGNFIVTHNSFLTRDIFYHHKNIPSGIVFSGTEEASPFFGDFIPDSFIHSEYKPDLIDSVMLRQKRKIRETKAKGLSESGKHSSNNMFIVLDDMLHEAQNWKKEKTIKSIFFNGRHYNFLFILTMQYPLGIPPELRSNIDYVFIFNESSIKNRKKIYEDYAGMIPSFDYFCNILDACTQNFECMVIKTSGNSTDLRDQVFWYKAEAHNNFRVGHPKLWNYHSSNYNENYEEENDKNLEEFDKLKKKFANTRKLKVIVNRQGDIVDYDEWG
jgi:hypothetical protein